MAAERRCVTSLYLVEVGSWLIRTGICVAELGVYPSPSYFAYNFEDRGKNLINNNDTDYTGNTNTKYD